MVNATSLVKSLFIMPTEDTYILFRIEFLVVVSTVLFLAMFILDIFRGHFHSAIIKAILSIVDNVSDSIVLYVMGAMQTAPFKNQLFPVWAIVLVGFRHSIGFISGYGIPDQDGRRFIEWRNVVKLLGVAFLNKTRGSKFAYPLWSLWGLQIVRSWYRFHAHSLAFNSVWHGRSSELVSECIRTMEGNKYLVYGESIILEKPRYVLRIDTNPRETRAQARAQARAKDQAQRENTTRPIKPQARSCPESLITLDKIWQCNGALLHTQGDNIKDLSLAFSLSRLLRCRLEDVALHKDSIPITKNLVKLTIIEQEAKRAFGVMELEIAFLNDYFNTCYPMVFWCGFPSLHLSLIMSVATFAVACWLSVDIRRVYKTPKDEVAHVINGVNVDMIITWLFMCFMMFKEIWEMVSYLLSDWTRLLLACTYVRWVCRCVRNGRMEKFISSFFTSKIANRRWHGVIDQYVFLQSYDYSPSVWNLMHTISTGAIPKKEEGEKLNEHINIPECVKPAILMALRSLDLTRAHLLDVIPSLLAEPRKRYRWACFELPTSSHIILVWHIATSLCEIRFAQDRDINLTNPGFPLSALLYLTSFCRRRRPPQPFLVNEKKILDDVLKTRYTVANSLSRYCAYLLVSKPDLVPDSFLVPKKIFEETVKEARDILKGSDSLEKRYNTLIEEADNAAQDTGNSNNRNVVQQGAKLAKELIDHEREESRWEILAEVWAYLLVHIAPSWKAAAHKKCLESGGEFITHIWALLWHCGIEQSMLWPVEDGHGNVVRGMRNLGNTCYFNAVLQSILALDKLRMRMLGLDAPTGSLTQELKKLFMETSDANGAGGTLVPENLFSIMCSRNTGFKCGVMEDSNNVLSSLLDGLNNEKPTIVESLFRGQVDKHVSSKECEHTSVTTQVLDLSLEIPSKKPVSIEDCFDLYPIGQVDDWDCTACSAAAGNASSNQKDTAVDDDQTEQSDSATHPKEQSSHPAEEQTRTPNQDKGKLPMLDGDAHQMEQSHNKHKEEEKIYRAAKVHFRIRKAPPVLTIQLKRFDYAHHDRSDKLEEHVSFQETLDITKFMDPRCVENEDYKYCLVAVIVHDGPILFEGHNFAYVRASRIGGQQQNGVTRSWFRASDENVTKVSLEEVLKCQAYILFYERVE